MGDFVKGNQFKDHPKRIADGIILHREIDRYTDNHKIVAQSKDKLREKYRHYSGVIVDMYYDHFLARNFSDYHDEPLQAFTERHFDGLNNYIEHMPPKAQHMLPYMVKGNWLLGYARMEGIQRALAGMSRRTKFDSKMDESIQDLTQNYSAFEAEFRAFFPQVIAHVSDFRQDLIT